MQLLTCEELLLIGLDDEKGGTTWLGNWSALRTAVLVDAVAARAVLVTDDRLQPAQVPAHPLLRRLHAAVAEDDEPRGIVDWHTRVGAVLDPLVQSVAAGLVERGVLEQRHEKKLGLFRTVRYPEVDARPERELRARLRGVLLDGHAPSAHDTLLLAVLHGDFGGIDRLVGDEERSVRTAARARATDIAEHAAQQPALRAAGEAAALTAALVITTAVVPTIIVNSGS